MPRVVPTTLIDAGSGLPIVSTTSANRPGLRQRNGWREAECKSDRRTRNNGGAYQASDGKVHAKPRHPGRGCRRDARIVERDSVTRITESPAEYAPRSRRCYVMSRVRYGIVTAGVAYKNASIPRCRGAGILMRRMLAPSDHHAGAEKADPARSPLENCCTIGAL